MPIIKLFVRLLATIQLQMIHIYVLEEIYVCLIQSIIFWGRGKAYFACFLIVITQPYPCRNFKMIIGPNNFLTVWWTHMNPKDKEIANTHIKHLPSLIEMDAWPEIIHVLTKFWDDVNMVFHFEEVELTPIIEEVLTCYESIDMCMKRRITPNNNIIVPIIWNHQNFKDVLAINNDT